MITQIETFDACRVRPLPDQPRKRFRGIKELAESIREIGQCSPGIVTRVTDDYHFDAQLVDGERRLRACQLAGLPFRAEVRAIEAASGEDVFATSFAANFGRQAHDAIEIATGLARLQAAGRTMEQLGRIAGKSVSWVYNHLNLLKLHPSVQELMLPSKARNRGAKLTFQLGLLLTSLDESQQIAMARKITAGEGMSMTAARRLVAGGRRQHEAEKGEKVTPVSHAGRSFVALESCLASMHDRLGLFLDMPGPEINALIDSVDPFTRRDLMKTMADLRDSLESLAEAVEARLPAVKTNRANR